VGGGVIFILISNQFENQKIVETHRNVVHLVARHNHLLHPEREREERVLARLAVLGDAGLEAADRRVDDENRDVRLRKGAVQNIS
jgi:hypothetical protein